MQILAEDRPDEDYLLRRRFLDGIQASILSNRLNVGEATVYRRQRQALRHLAEVIQKMEAEVRAGQHAELEKFLPPPTYDRLFGVTTHLEHLQNILTPLHPPWLIALDGIGGIGKTSLANALARRLLYDFTFRHLAWVSARQEEFLPFFGLRKLDRPALSKERLIDALLEQLAESQPIPSLPQERLHLLKNLLKRQPHLVIIDNLETVADYREILPLLRHLANPSKFLLTTRHSLSAHTDILSLTLPELPLPEAAALLRHLQARQGVAPSLTDEQTEAIYSIAGGNPLALKLIAGQMATLPLPQILRNLREGEGRKIEELYTFIYRQSWQLLSLTARRVLLTMPLFSAQGASFEQLAQGSDVPPVALGDALEELALLSLVEVGGNLEHRRYRIHRLTET
ncbi:MAG: hypothetical protein D6819_05610, partial [Gammaproteobacteria bacterium]